MSSVHRDVEMKPALSLLSGEPLLLCNSKWPKWCRTGCRSPRIMANSTGCLLWCPHHGFPAITDFPPSLSSLGQARSHLNCHKAMKKRHYNRRILEVETASFCPLVFSTDGMCSKEAGRFIHPLADQISQRNPDLSYIKVVTHIGCRLSFALLRSSLRCLNGARRCHASLRRPILRVGLLHYWSTTINPT